MDKQLMKKLYSISRIVIVLIIFILFYVMFIHEDESFKILPAIFALIAFVISYPSSIISRGIIKIGDKFNSIVLKLIYYILIVPIITIIALVLIYFLIMFINDNIPTANELGKALGQALMILFFMIVCAIFIISPYIQSLIVLLLRRFIKK